jgi:hypothetical protein
MQVITHMATKPSLCAHCARYVAAERTQSNELLMNLFRKKLVHEIRNICDSSISRKFLLGVAHELHLTYSL